MEHLRAGHGERVARRELQLERVGTRIVFRGVFQSGAEAPSITVGASDLEMVVRDRIDTVLIDNDTELEIRHEGNEIRFWIRPWGVAGWSVSYAAEPFLEALVRERNAPAQPA